MDTIMPDLQERDLKILHVYKLFKVAMRQHGRNIMLPTNVNPRKTYGWRYLSNFVDQAHKAQLHDELIPDTIEAIVDQANTRCLLNRGFSILNRPDLLKFCIEIIEQKIRSDNDKVDSLRIVREFLQKHNSDLLGKVHSKAHANMTAWFQMGELTADYVALSKSCQMAIRKLQPYEATIFPPLKDLLKIKWGYCSNQQILEQIKEILDSDFIGE